ncbi:hypothetical protein PHYBOEH_009961 [Phytophthora boehmeriae]|uniref:Uncharacterized protein n=1 Tax=Phytophthora boehmeriae TaxID=109152 RepID=A0A8T1X3H9_9STRA|nr:hypothetical protein PHYBOEH_009961 [Phytophthora boehmeriae]
MAQIEVLHEVAASALAALLASLDAATIDRLREKLLGSTGTPSSELQSVQELAELLPKTVNSDLQTQLQSLIRLVKALCRLVIKYVGVVTADPDNVKALLALDDNLLPILRVLKAFVTRLRDRDLDEAVYSDKGLLQWLPFVLTACYFVENGELPGAELMQSVSVAGDVLEECSSLLKLDRESAVSKYVGQIVALCSQDVDKEQWVSAKSINKKVMLRVVEKVPFPHLGGDLLGRLLALTFPLVDDLTDATQLVGARLLCHIVHNVTPTELRWYSDILMEVLNTAIVTRKPATLDILIDCLVESLDKVSPPGELKHYERFVPRLLRDTSLCSEVARCPRGLEVRLENLLVLPMQSIRILRDNDTVVVQCPLVDEDCCSRESLSSEEGVEIQGVLQSSQAKKRCVAKKEEYAIETRSKKLKTVWGVRNGNCTNNGTNNGSLFVETTNTKSSGCTDGSNGNSCESSSDSSCVDSSSSDFRSSSLAESSISDGSSPCSNSTSSSDNEDSSDSSNNSSSNNNSSESDYEAVKRYRLRLARRTTPLKRTFGSC